MSQIPIAVIGIGSIRYLCRCKAIKKGYSRGNQKGLVGKVKSPVKCIFLPQKEAVRPIVSLCLEFPALKRHFLVEIIAYFCPIGLCFIYNGKAGKRAFVVVIFAPKISVRVIAYGLELASKGVVVGNICYYGNWKPEG